MRELGNLDIDPNSKTAEMLCKQEVHIHVNAIEIHTIRRNDDGFAIFNAYSDGKRASKWMSECAFAGSHLNGPDLDWCMRELFIQAFDILKPKH